MNKILPIILVVIISDYAHSDNKLTYMCESTDPMYWVHVWNKDMKVIDERYEKSKDDFNSEDMLNFQMIEDRMCIQSETEMRSKNNTVCPEYKVILNKSKDNNKIKNFVLENFNYKFNNKIHTSAVYVTLEDIGLMEPPIYGETERNHNIKVPYITLLIRLANNQDIVLGNQIEKNLYVTRTPVLSYLCMMIKSVNDSSEFNGMSLTTEPPK
tara:strand:+ start:313 stop:948 length:636 start_codon:yes stop_codon:yes gene_type:complete